MPAWADFFFFLFLADSKEREKLYSTGLSPSGPLSFQLYCALLLFSLLARDQTELQFYAVLAAWLLRAAWTLQWCYHEFSAAVLLYTLALALHSALLVVEATNPFQFVWLLSLALQFVLALRYHRAVGASALGSRDLGRFETPKQQRTHNANAFFAVPTQDPQQFVVPSVQAQQQTLRSLLREKFFSK